jgi:uncharacterized protein YcbK (DUF882 family)
MNYTVINEPTIIPVQLTPNFKKSEFDSKDGATMPDDVLIEIRKVATALQALRDRVRQPVTIHSGYRSPEHNKKVGGAVNSYHVKGMAADISVKNMTPQQVMDELKLLMITGRIPLGGVKAYERGNFTHYDIRGRYASW